MRIVIIVALISSVLGAQAPILHYSNTRGFALFTDPAFLGTLLVQSVISGGIIFFSVLIIGMTGIAVGRALKWVTA
jgi:hypothetical protein